MHETQQIPNIAVTVTTMNVTLFLTLITPCAKRGIERDENSNCNDSEHWDHHCLFVAELRRTLKALANGAPHLRQFGETTKQKNFGEDVSVHLPLQNLGA